MPRHIRHTRPEYRFTVIDDSVTTWGVYDRQKQELHKGLISNPQDARLLAEKLNLTPPEETESDREDQEASS